MSYFNLMVGVFFPHFLDRLDFCKMIDMILDEKKTLFGCISIEKRRNIIDYTVGDPDRN